MVDKNARAKVQKAMESWMASPTNMPVVRVLEGKRPANDHPSFFKEEPRVVIALEGTGRYVTIENGREMLFDLQPGQALFLAPCTWSCPIPWMTYRSLAMTLRPDLTRVTIHSRKAIRKDGKIPWRYVAEWQTQSSLGERGRHLLELLADRSPNHTGEGFYQSLVNLLVGEVAGLVEAAPESGRSNDTILWHSLCDYISAHWSEPTLSRERVAEFFQRHPNHLSRFFNQHTNQNFRSYLNEIRLKRSLQFLRDLRYNVTDVSTLCGFTDLQYFIRCFHKRFGLTPGEYRKRKIE